LSEVRTKKMPNLGMPELGVILALVLLVFGPKKLPEIARGLGQGIKEFKQAMQEVFSSEEPSAPTRPDAAAPPERSIQDRGEAGR
jgi:sec-independent protein translocase protein TatA